MSSSAPHRRRALLAVPLVAGLLGAGPAPAATADTGTAPVLRDGHGITVRDVRAVPDLRRTWEVTVTDPAVDPAYSTQSGALRVRITLPEDYATSTRSYPTLYLLHGQDAGAEQWTTSGDAERITAGRDVIVVMPEGGKAGWFTDWVSDAAHPQNWEQFHVQHLIPWVEDSLRAAPGKQHRAVAGLSMGGYGALHYAAKHPDTFNHVSSYSGALDLDDPAIRSAVVGSVALQRMGDGTGPFGSPVWPFDAAWKRENPAALTERLRGTGVSLYAGDGLGRDDSLTSRLFERVSGSSSGRVSARLRAAGIPHHWDMYGHDVTYGGYTCNGGHTWSCWQMSLAKDIDRVLGDIR